ncbi:uncharacterized membrane protein YhaH (DUF805 family) [Kribbella sp. VKM Ac-2527]|jgi:uncharacterized membrane protein YhaH (DUF805 family)|uniref:Uncharacterized membrane protein YhaH (DUF805 family) n=1 Tax=Kribbella caucasensis TaxID=2512215 RepID=A0A4R6K8V1_9ACTN|nr:DUF805 domain-containing protein [Kribbella sp. VKM Ac-2527]TDO45259.1 uncharacterized membrane protein YhaH (DUF805 family) [Kribbella sp. VKM Ac-2527]
MQWYTEVLKKYAVFSGRARRKEYWMFFLFNLVISVILSIVDSVAGTNGSGVGIISTIYSLAVLLPSIAVLVRRLHDTGKSGFWVFIGLVPLIGAIVLIVFAATEGNPGDNQYGPDPKAAERFGAGAGNAEPGYPTV